MDAFTVYNSKMMTDKRNKLLHLNGKYIKLAQNSPNEMELYLNLGDK
jgi:hypothetical protein